MHAGLHENAAMLRSEEETRGFLSAVLHTQPHIDTPQENIIDNDIASVVDHLLAKVSFKFFFSFNNLIFLKGMDSLHKLEFTYPYNFATYCCTP